MSRIVRTGRRAGLLLAGAGSVLGGVALVNALIRPGVIDTVGTTTLGAILALLMLPFVVFVMMRVEHSTPEPVPTRPQANDGLGHSPAPRRSPSHRRRAARTPDRVTITRG